MLHWFRSWVFRLFWQKFSIFCSILWPKVPIWRKFHFEFFYWIFDFLLYFLLITKFSVKISILAKMSIVTIGRKFRFFTQKIVFYPKVRVNILLQWNFYTMKFFTNKKLHNFTIIFLTTKIWYFLQWIFLTTKIHIFSIFFYNEIFLLKFVNAWKRIFCTIIFFNNEINLTINFL